VTFVVRLLASVTLNGLAPAGVRILAALDRATQILKRDLVVTCGTDSHPSDDPHTKGCALDVRTKDLPEGAILALVAALRADLGADFTVLYEVPTTPNGVLASIAYVNTGASAAHLHIQLRKGFGSYPPAPAATGVLV
jgi:hypothetical protein